MFLKSYLKDYNSKGKHRTAKNRVCPECYCPKWELMSSAVAVCTAQPYKGHQFVRYFQQALSKVTMPRFNKKYHLSVQERE